MLNKDSVFALLNNVIKRTQHFVTISVMGTEEGLTRFANSEIHQNVVKSDATATLTLMAGKKISSVSTNALDEESLVEALNFAEDKLKFLPEGDYQYPKISSPSVIDKDSYNTELDEVFSIEKRAQYIKDALSILPKDFTAAGSLSMDKTILLMVNSEGIKRFTRGNSVTYNIVVTHKDDSSGFAEINVNDPSKLDILALTKKAFNIAKEGIDPVTIEPGHYDIIMPPHATSAFLNFLGYMGLSSKAHHFGYSFLKDKLNEKVFGENITIIDDWKNPYVSSIPFDFEGVERKQLNLITDGVFKHIPFDSKYSHLMGQENTGHSIGYDDQGGIPLHMVMSGGDSSIDEMIKSTSKGLLVTRFHYTNVVNPMEGLITGLTRDGLFLIEDGKIKCPVKNMRFTESIPNVLNNAVSLSKETVPVKGFFGNFVVPAMKVKNFHITGKTS